jgi:glycosyltransferase involved in cell wall biosynthesis
MIPLQFKYNITVLMSVYNTPFPLIKRAIDSVLNQDYKDFELIILDDGSDIDVQHKIINYDVHHENKIT